MYESRKAYFLFFYSLKIQTFTITKYKMRKKKENRKKNTPIISTTYKHTVLLTH